VNLNDSFGSLAHNIGGYVKKTAYGNGREIAMGMSHFTATIPSDASNPPFELFSLAMSAAKNASIASDLGTGSWKADQKATLLQYLRSHAKILQVHRTWDGLGDPNVYQVAAAIGMEDRRLLFSAATTCLLQGGLLAYATLGIEWEEYSSSNLPLAFIVTINIVPIVLGLLRSGQSASSSGLWTAAAKKSPYTTPVLRAVDLTMNAFLPCLVFVLSFFVIACAAAPMDAVLNSVALLFIPSLDDEITKYVFAGDAKRIVTDLLTSQIVKEHEDKAAKLQLQRTPKAGQTLDSILGVELPQLYEDISIGRFQSFSKNEYRIVGGEQNPWWECIQDATADPTRNGGYLFSKIVYQLADAPSWAAAVSPCVIRWLEFTPLGDHKPFELGKKGGAEVETVTLEGAPLVVVGLNFGAVMYALRVLRFGGDDDVVKFCSFFSMEEPSFFSWSASAA